MFDKAKKCIRINLSRINISSIWAGKMRDHTKLKELIVYIADRCESRLNVGATMLNKILFFADFTAYAKLGEPITGEEYFKLPKGPAPKYLLEARDELIGENRIHMKVRPTLKGDQHRIINIGPEADLSIFSGEQISIVDSIIEALKDEDAESVSGLSHKFYGWQITKAREIIPYATIYLREPKPEDPPEKVLNAIRKLTEGNGARPTV